MEYPTGPLPEFHVIKTVEEFDAIKARFSDVCGCGNMLELADFLETTPARISDARRRLRIPAEWLRMAFLKAPVNPFWLLFGTGERYL